MFLLLWFRPSLAASGSVSVDLVVRSWTASIIGDFIPTLLVRKILREPLLPAGLNVQANVYRILASHFKSKRRAFLLSTLRRDLADLDQLHAAPQNLHRLLSLAGFS